MFINTFGSPVLTPYARVGAGMSFGCACACCLWVCTSLATDVSDIERYLPSKSKAPALRMRGVHAGASPMHANVFTEAPALRMRGVHAGASPMHANVPVCAG